MMGPEFDYAYLPWPFKFFVCSKCTNDQKVLHQLLLFTIFPTSISHHMVKKRGSVACYVSRLLE